MRRTLQQSSPAHGGSVMTTPAPGLVTGSFAGTLTPAQVWALLNALVEGSPFASSLTRANTSTGKLAFPTVGPTGFAWLEELAGGPQPPAQRQGPDRGGGQDRGPAPGQLGNAVGRRGQHHDLGDRCAGRQPEPRPGPGPPARHRHPPAERDHRPGRPGGRPDADRRGRCRHRGHRRGRRHHQHHRDVPDHLRRRADPHRRPEGGWYTRTGCPT